jgi:hypothetical protein
MAATVEMPAESRTRMIWHFLNVWERYLLTYRPPAPVSWRVYRLLKQVDKTFERRIMKKLWKSRAKLLPIAFSLMAGGQIKKDG